MELKMPDIEVEVVEVEVSHYLCPTCGDKYSYSAAAENCWLKHARSDCGHAYYGPIIVNDVPEASKPDVLGGEARAVTTARWDFLDNGRKGLPLL